MSFQTGGFKPDYLQAAGRRATLLTTLIKSAFTNDIFTAIARYDRLGAFLHYVVLSFYQIVSTYSKRYTLVLDLVYLHPNRVCLLVFFVTERKDQIIRV